MTYHLNPQGTQDNSHSHQDVWSESPREPGTLISIPIKVDEDVVRARDAGRSLATKCGFSAWDRVRITTAISDIARTIAQRDGDATVQLHVVWRGPTPGIRVRARNPGPRFFDIAPDEENGVPRPGGFRLQRAYLVMDEFMVVLRPREGTMIVMTKWRQDDDGESSRKQLGGSTP
jgi:serine/threonine-protein kinase RsbT